MTEDLNLEEGSDLPQGWGDYFRYKGDKPLIHPEELGDPPLLGVEPGVWLLNVKHLEDKDWRVRTPGHLV